MSKEWCSTVPQGIRITVSIAPNAKKNEITGILDDALKIRLQAQPIEGKANDALIRYLADVLGVPKSAISIMHGHTGRRKIIEVASAKLTADGVRQMLAPDA